jgi:ubiquinone/menaquinone biosynthesis C-methylase UbiE
MAAAGALVVSVDLMAGAVRLDARCKPVIGHALHVPLGDQVVDFVFCASLIEHVPNPQALMEEIVRVLRPGGVCYLSFPPFYSPVGGHEYAPFHYLGERLAMRLARKRSQKGHPAWVQQLYAVNANPTSFASIYADWGLYMMTIAKARRLVMHSGLTLLDQSTRYFPHSFARWPVLGELLTWHVQFLLQRPASGANP